jgi:hypothetical protein
MAALMLAAVLFGTATAAPAQAVSGSTVYLAQVSSNFTGYVRTWNINNWYKRIDLGETANNVDRFCPPGSNWDMLVTGPAGTTRAMYNGACYSPTKSGTYSVELWNY